MPLEKRYQIGAAIHIGQIATAYEAIQRGLDRKVLLKVIHPQWKNDPELLERFSREGKAAAKVSDHNVVKIFDSGWEDGLPYIALEWIDGGTLAERLKGGPLPQTEVKKIAIELLKGLSAVHKVHLLHRDIKPDNIMLGNDSEARLTDFSLAGLGHVSTLTGHDGIVGSPAYMAPELLRGLPPDERSDLYALGLVLLEALTGSNPFQASDPMTSINLVQNTTLPKLTGRPRLDPALATLIDLLTNKAPDQRPKNAEAALAYLNGSALDEKILAVSVVKVGRIKEHHFITILAVVTIAVLIALLVAGENTKFASPQAKIFNRVHLPPRTIEPEITLGSPDKEELHAMSRVNQKDEIASLPSVSTPGTVVLLVKPWGNVSIDGKSVGATPMEPLELAMGTHSLVITHPQLPSLTREFVVEPACRDTISFDLRRDAVASVITAIPWGYLWVDGDSVGLLPRSDPVWLASGRHQLTISHPDYKTWSETVDLAPGERVNLRINLEDGTLIATPSSGGDRNNGE